MIHSTPLRVMYGHCDDHAVGKIYLLLYKYKGNTLHHTELRWLEGKNDLTWLEQLCDLTWLDLKKIAMTWLDSRLDLTWLVTRARATCYNTACDTQRIILHHLLVYWAAPLATPPLTSVIHVPGAYGPWTEGRPSQNLKLSWQAASCPFYLYHDCLFILKLTNHYPNSQT